jgi:hypothetical protein
MLPETKDASIKLHGSHNIGAGPVLSLNPFGQAGEEKIRVVGKLTGFWKWLHTLDGLRLVTP